MLSASALSTPSVSTTAAIGTGRAEGTGVGGSSIPAGLARASGLGSAPLGPAAVPSTAARGVAATSAAAMHAATTAKPAPAHPAAPPRLTFAMVQAELSRQTSPAVAGTGGFAADRLLPVPTSGPQSFTPIGTAQYQNATTIVAQALQMHMGIRSAVIAVATSIQESKLVNVDYGSGESLGLFQQEPDMGWGSAQQIMDPAYAADAFLGALQQYQANNPDWASQPLYQAAQGVQGSAFPYAYAQWETQAAQLVSQIVMQLR